MKKKPDVIFSLNSKIINNNPTIKDRGIYVIYYKHICLYVGQSRQLWRRPYRIFSNKIFSTNIILKSILNNIDKNKLSVNLYFYDLDLKDRLKIEIKYMKKLKPICEIQNIY